MDPATIFAVLMALLAYSSIAGGEVLMKMGISWLGWQGPKTGAYFRSRRLWVAGLILANLYGIPSAVALKFLPPHIVGAFSGWVVVLLVFLSHRVLGERLTQRDLYLSFLFVAGIVGLNLLERSTQPEVIDTTALAVLSLLPAVLLAIGLIKVFSDRLRTVLFSAAAGMSAGLMVIFLRLLVLRHGFLVGRYFGSVHLYLYVVFALMSLAALQLAFQRGAMILTAAMKYATAIITPFLGAVLVFSLTVSSLQWAFAALIVFAVVRLIRHR